MVLCLFSHHPGHKKHARVREREGGDGCCASSIQPWSAGYRYYVYTYCTTYYACVKSGLVVWSGAVVLRCGGARFPRVCARARRRKKKKPSLRQVEERIINFSCNSSQPPSKKKLEERAPNAPRGEGGNLLLPPSLSRSRCRGKETNLNGG